MNRYNIEDLVVGEKIGFSKTITADMMDMFRLLSDDESTIHMNADFAKERGFKGRVVYGMLSSIFFSTIVGMYLPGENGLLQSVSCDFLRPVYIGETIHISACVEAVHKSVQQITIKVNIKNDGDDIVARGKIKALVLGGNS